MSELPELPPAPDRSRPVPSGGLEAAVSGGRRRRQRALGAAGGGAAVAVLLVAAVLSVPGSGRPDSLVAATPTPSPLVSPDPERSPTVGPLPSVQPSTGPAAGGAPTPATVAAPASPGAGGLVPGPGASPASSPQAPGAAPRPVPISSPRPVAERPAYVEDTDEDAAGGCVAGRTTGCTYNSGGGREVVRRGSSAQVLLGECVAADDIGDRVYSFSGGQEKDVVVTPEDDLSREVYRFSSTVRYVQGPHERRARRGKCLQWTGRWDLVTTDGQPVPAGSYVVSLRVRADRQVYENAPEQETDGFDETISTRFTVVD